MIRIRIFPTSIRSRDYEKLFIAGVATVTIGAILSACASRDAFEVTKGMVIQNATVVNTRDGSLASGMSVLIDEGKIQKIMAGRFIRLSGSAQAIDASGKYLVPGYLDMHTHAMSAADQQPTYWPLLIANGITGIREMSGSAALIQRARQLNADRAAGRVDAPEILMIPGDIFGGQAPTAPLAVQFVQQQKANGADFIKISAGARDPVLAILGAAKNQGLTVAGHLVPSISALESSNAGWRAIEHLGAGWGLMLDCANDETSIRQAVLSGQAARPPFPATFVLNPRIYDGAQNAQLYQRIFDTYSDAKCQSLSQAFVKNETWQVPTLIRLRTQNFGGDPLYRADPNLVYVDKTTRALWEKLGQDFVTTLPPAAVATLQQFYGLEKKVTQLMKQNGVKMLAGSDLGGIWVIPGFGLHQEFRELAASGLSPLEVLQMTTLNGAQFLKREATMGTVDEGKNADLVLLDANPLVDVANLGKIAAVFLKGKYLSKDALKKKKKDVAAEYEKQSVKTLESALYPAHKH